jgi:hypothetical protein
VEYVKHSPGLFFLFSIPGKDIRVDLEEEVVSDLDAPLFPQFQQIGLEKLVAFCLQQVFFFLFLVLKRTNQ